jgi:mannosyltransferase OCH1-like enzyme
MDGTKRFAEKYGFQYMLWDNEAVSKLTMVNRDIFEGQTQYCGKADVLRYEILHQYGGVYIDADMAITRPEQLDALIKGFDKDCGLGFEVDNKLICNAVILAIKGSAFMKCCIDALPKRDFTQLPWISTGPMLVTDMVVKYQTQIPVTLYRSTVFYPVRWHGIKDIDLHTKMVLPSETVMFQYGYSTNNLEDKISQT